MNNYMLLIMAAFLIVFMMWSSRSRKQQMQKMEQEKRDQLAAVTPGEWVRTRVGFWGLFVDLDGDIVVLETTDGHEMYWEREMIAEIGGQPPLAEVEQTDASADEAETVEEDASVLGLGEEDEKFLDQEDAQSFDVRDTDEQQK